MGDSWKKKDALSGRTRGIAYDGMGRDAIIPSFNLSGSGPSHISDGVGPAEWVMGSGRTTSHEVDQNLTVTRYGAVSSVRCNPQRYSTVAQVSNAQAGRDDLVWGGGLGVGGVAKAWFGRAWVKLPWQGDGQPGNE